MTIGDVFCLDPEYATTRRVTRTPWAGVDQPIGKIKTTLLIDSRKGRRVGGLRTQGYFKASETSADDAFTTDAKEPTHVPLITVITAVLNGAKTLEESILSVIGQSYDNVEYIIVDGASSDASVEVIRKYEHAIDYWISEPDSGIYDAWNKGVSLSTGDWIAFLGADDSYQGTAICDYMDLLTRRQSRHPDYLSSRGNLTSSSRIIRKSGKSWDWKIFRSYMNVMHPGSLHSRRLFERFGLFDPTYRICGDYEFLLRPGPTLQAAFLDEITVNMGIGGVSTNDALALREAARAKSTTGGRNPLTSQVERSIGLCKMKLRRWLWY